MQKIVIGIEILKLVEVQYYLLGKHLYQILKVDEVIGGTIGEILDDLVLIDIGFHHIRIGIILLMILDQNELI
jgi:hypothetical protein